jgi:methylglyoxal synthase
LKKKKRIALVAHDERKKDLLEWVQLNIEKIMPHELFATGSTGKLIAETCKLDVTRMKSGPLGGDQQLGAMISNGQLDMLFFFWDPMTAQPHDVDVKALLRMAVLYNIVVVNNPSTADFVISSDFFGQAYEPIRKDYGNLI